MEIKIAINSINLKVRINNSKFNSNIFEGIIRIIMYKGYISSFELWTINSSNLTPRVLRTRSVWSD